MEIHLTVLWHFAMAYFSVRPPGGCDYARILRFFDWMKVFRSLGSLQSPGSLGSPVHLFVLVGVAVCINSHVVCHKILFLIFAVLVLD